MHHAHSWLASIIALTTTGVLTLACTSDGGSGGTDNNLNGGAGGGGSGGAAGGSAGTSGGSTSGGSAGVSGGSGGGGTLPDGCTILIEESADPSDAMQTALIEATSGDVICVAPGTYAFTHEISLATAQNITLRGTGAVEDVIFDFATQESGDDGVFVTADGFTIENVWIKNTRGNGIAVKADNSTFRNLKVSWDSGSVTENGAYAVYPTNCDGTLIEDVEVIGASDAGVYVGQCRNAIVRRVKAHGNVLGIEVENTINADVYDNEAYDNTGGILIDLLPNKEQKESNFALVRDNTVYENNRANFAPPGGVIASVVPGTGIWILAASDTEVKGNTIRDNTGAAIMVFSYELIGVLLGEPSNDPATNQWPKRTYIHDNTFSNNGTAPETDYQLIGVTPLENVLWDGFIDPALLPPAGDGGAPDGGAADAGSDPYPGVSDEVVELCLGTTEQASFRNFNVPGGLQNQSTDPTPHQCTLDPLPELPSP